MKTAARREFCRKSQASRLHDRRKIVQHIVRKTFIEHALVTIRLEVEFQTLELDAKLIGDKREGQRPIIRLTGFGTQRRKLRTHVRDDVIASRARILEKLKYLRRGLFNNVWHN